jgi:alpha-ribazole phosphatase/probable phosphoglycerate mutase
MKLLLVRHGEINSNINRIYAGKSPEMLNEKGISQAEEVAERIKTYYKVSEIYVSPMKRTIQTAKIIADKIGKEILIENAFREMELGPWEGLSENEISNRYPDEWELWLKRPAELKLPERENLEDLLNRALTGIEKIYERLRDQDVAVVVTHVALIRVLLLWRAKKNLNLYKTIHIPNAKVFEVNT